MLLTLAYYHPLIKEGKKETKIERKYTENKDFVSLIEDYRGTN
jgi:hypothetical protein